MKNVFKLERMPVSSDLYSTPEAIKKFGQPNENAQKCKVRPQMVTIESPYELKLYARNATQKTRRISCHKIVAPYVKAVLARTLEQYGAKEIDRLGLNVYGGCFNPRPIRGGSSWSKHAFAIAFDWLQAENGLHTPFAKATFSRPEYKAWLDTWQECGFANLGRVASFGRDAMHFEFMREADSQITEVK